MQNKMLSASEAGMIYSKQCLPTGLRDAYCGNAVDSDSGLRTGEISNLRLNAEAVIKLIETERRPTLNNIPPSGNGAIHAIVNS